MIEILSIVAVRSLHSLVCASRDTNIASLEVDAPAAANDCWRRRCCDHRVGNYSRLCFGGVGGGGGRSAGKKGGLSDPTASLRCPAIGSFDLPSPMSSARRVSSFRGCPHLISRLLSSWQTRTAQIQSLTCLRNT